jgi:hypothetical protein
MMKTLTVLFFLMISAAGLQAQVAANWSFPGGSASATSVGQNISASAITAGSDVGGLGNSGSDFFGYDNWPSGAIDLNAYLQLQVSASSSYYLVLNSISLNLRRSTTGSSGAGPTSYSLRSSLDNYTTDLASGTLTTSYQTVAVTLPAAFQSIPNNVTFRIYGFNAVVSSGGSSRLVTNSIIVKGQSVPGTLATQSIGLTARADAHAVDLQWDAVGFEDGTSYQLQRSTDGSDFSTIAQPMSGAAGGNAQLTSASFADNNAPSGQLFYRIMAQSPDGSNYISPIATVQMQGQTAAEPLIRAIAAEGSSVRALLHLEAGDYQLSIRSMDGKAIYHQLVSGQTGDATTDISFGTRPHGIYILTLMGSGTTYSREFLY